MANNGELAFKGQIGRIRQNIANAYTQAGQKGATMPSVQNSDNLATTIASIKSGGGGTADNECDLLLTGGYGGLTREQCKKIINGNYRCF